MNMSECLRLRPPSGGRHNVEEYENNNKSLHEPGRCRGWAAGKCLTPVNFNSNESLGTLPFPQRSEPGAAGRRREIREIHRF